MTFIVKEIFSTLQGEGAQAGSAAVFCRFSGCNLWSGREEDRKDAHCTFCDTDFVGTNGVGGGRFTSAKELAGEIHATWVSAAPEVSEALVVFTGGEPLLQLNSELIDACHDIGIRVAIETNGTQPVPHGVDWVCVSPKPGPPLVATSGDELKLAFPQSAFTPEQFERLDFTHRFLQPIDGPRKDENLAAAIAYCKKNPKWRLSLQTHKLIGLP